MSEFENLGSGKRSRSVLAAPLRADGGRVIGVLVLISHARRGGWNIDDLTVVQAIADEAAVAVARAGLFEEKALHATTDPLTKVGNRRAFEERLTELTGATAVIAIDVDHLKPINDEFGHEAGDMLLIEVARTLRAQLRAGDQLLRIGGDEFVSIMDATTEAEAVAIAERMRVSLHGVALPHGRARISAGVSAGGGGVHALWLAADEALSKAKKDGRDRVVVAGDRSARSAGRARRPVSSQASSSKSAHSPALQRMSSMNHRGRPTPAAAMGEEGRAVTRQRVTAANSTRRAPT